MKTRTSQFSHIKSAAAALAAVLVLQTSLPAADLAVRATVPFDFYVGHTFLPAGDYNISTLMNGKVIQVLGKNGKAASIVSYETPTRDQGSQHALVFHRYGSMSFLAELKERGGGTTRVLLTSKTEQRISKAGSAIGVASILNLKP